MNNKITRRKFIKWAAIVGGAISVSSFLSIGGKAILDRRKRAKKLAGSTKERPVANNSGFTPRECVLLSALAALIVPTQFIYYKNKLGCEEETIRLFPILVKDVKQVFYTSQISWDWPGYDGPPMPNGYLGQLSKCEQYW